MQAGQTGLSASRVPADRVAQRAYEKWLKRGCVHGYDLQDWVEAERELLAEQNRAANTATAAAGGHQGFRR
jgi:hypothetical protein